MKNALSSFYLLLVLVLNYSFVYGQNCTGAENQLTFSANQMEAILSASGSLFGNGQETGFGVKSLQEEKIPTISAHGLWLGGKDLGGGLKVAASTDGLAQGITDYHPGTLYNGDPDYPNGGVFADPFRGTTNELYCENWDKIWMVTKTEIEFFRQDFQDDGVLNENHPAILAWPGVGSPTFLDFNDFSLPSYVPEGLAPFFDVDEDGIYNPLNGDYPHVPQSAILPDLIAWSVYTDGGGHNVVSGSSLRLQFEIQQTSWAYDCFEVDWLNNSVFTSFKLINKAIEPLDSTYLGLWTDFDMGCPEDDYIGSVPTLNTFYAYNADNEDGLQSGGCAINNDPYFNLPPPVQAITFLNQPMTSFMYYEESGMDTPFALMAPSSPQQHYNFLTARFRDGNFMIAEGNGYDPESNLPSTPFAFSGQPDQPSEWSLFQNPGLVNRYGIGSVELGLILPDDIVIIDVAYSLHQAPDNNHLQNVNLMSATIPTIQDIYNSGFTTLCGVTKTQEIDRNLSVTLFPNPTTDKLTIQLPGIHQIDQVIVYASTGQMVMQRSDRLEANTIVDVSELTAGVYFVHVFQDDKIAVARFVKQ